MKKILFILVSLIIISCSKDDKSEAYYNFRDDDFNKLVSFELNEIITYENQFGDEIFYEVNEVTIDYKKQLSRGSWVTPGSIKWFYYDAKKVKMNSDFTNFIITYKFQRFPINVELAKENKYTEYPSEFYGRVDLFLWNGLDYNGVSINYESNSETMTIDGVDYKNVYTIQSNNPNPIITSSGVEKNIHKIYYSKKQGVIGFDDLDNVQWRIVN